MQKPHFTFILESEYMDYTYETVFLTYFPRHVNCWDAPPRPVTNVTVTTRILTFLGSGIGANLQESKGGLPMEVDRVREAYGKNKGKVFGLGEGLEGF